MKTAILSVAYNRVDSLKRQLASLERAHYPETTTLIISIDKSDTEEVEAFCDHYHWSHGELRVVKHNSNMGLRAHMLSLGNYFDEFEALIILEDDITVSSSFYYYAKQCIDNYYGEPHIAGISLYAFPANYQTYLPFSPAKSEYDVFFMNCAQSWGEVWMKPQWQQFEQWHEQHAEHFSLKYLPPCLNQWPDSSWLKYHTRYCIEKDLYFVYPYYSHSTNNADPGTHNRQPDTFFQAPLQATLQTEYRLPGFEETDIKYDGFFQPKYLSKSLEIPEEDLCVDMFSDKPSCLYKHYLLTNKRLPYKVVRSFAMQLKPIEMNIIEQRTGNDIWLYDTTQPQVKPHGTDRYTAFTYFYQKAFYKMRTMVGPCRMLSLFGEMVFNKIKSFMRKK